MLNPSISVEEVYAAHRMPYSNSLKHVKEWNFYRRRSLSLLSTSKKSVDDIRHSSKHYRFERCSFKIHPLVCCHIKYKTGELTSSSSWVFRKCRQPKELTRKHRRAPLVEITHPNTKRLKSFKVMEHLSKVDPSQSVATLRVVYPLSRVCDIPGYMDLRQKQHLRYGPLAEWKYFTFLAWQGEMLIAVAQTVNLLQQSLLPWYLWWWSFDIPINSDREMSLVLTFGHRDFNPKLKQTLARDPRL